MDWENKIGEKVIFVGKIKMLNKDTVGILNYVHDDWCVIIYPQNSAYESDGKGGYKPIKNAPLQIYAHSCKLTEIKLFE